MNESRTQKTPRTPAPQLRALAPKGFVTSSELSSSSLVKEMEELDYLVALCREDGISVRDEEPKLSLSNGDFSPTPSTASEESTSYGHTDDRPRLPQADRRVGLLDREEGRDEEDRGGRAACPPGRARARSLRVSSVVTAARARRRYALQAPLHRREPR